MESAPDAAAVRSTLGSYRLLGEVGKDPLGVLFLACPAGARSFPKWAIVRRMHAGLAKDPAMVHSFIAATQAAVRMVHKNVASTFDVGGRMELPWSAREYMFGATVVDVIASLVAQRARMPWGLAGFIVGEAAEGVAAVRARLPDYGPPMGFLAGAAAPSVFITRAGEVKIVDGCLPLIDGAPLVDSIALPYRPREAAVAGPAAGRADVFSLGVVLWELVSGRRLFAGQDDRETVQHVEANVVPLLARIARAPSLVDDLVQRALGSPAGDAPPFESAAELAEAIRQALAREERRAGPADVALMMSDMFEAVLTEQDAAVNQAWTREQALQAMGALPHEIASETELTRPMGETMRDTTTETSILLPGRRRVADGFDEIPTIPQGGATLVMGPASWRPRGAPPPNASPRPVAAPLIQFFDDEPTRPPPLERDDEEDTTLRPIPGRAAPEAAMETAAAPPPPRSRAPSVPPPRSRMPSVPPPRSRVPSVPPPPSRSPSRPPPSQGAWAPSASSSSRSRPPPSPSYAAPEPPAPFASTQPFPPPLPPAAPPVFPTPRPFAPPPAPSAPRPELPSLMEEDDDADAPSPVDRGPPVLQPTPIAPLAPPSPASLILPPIERAGVVPLPMRTSSSETVPRNSLVTSRTARSQSRAILTAAGVGFGLSCLAIAAVGLTMRYRGGGERPSVTAAAAPPARSAVAKATSSAQAPPAATPPPAPTPSAVGAWATVPTSAPPPPASVPELSASALPPSPPAATAHAHHARVGSPPESAPSGRSGLLSVFCTPTCDDVRDGAKSLGSSPVFKVPVSAGVHRLRLHVDSPLANKTVAVTVTEGETAVVRENVTP